MSTDNIKRKSFREYQLSRPNDTGGHVLTDRLYWALNEDCFIQITATFSCALIKIIDEALTNAVDACQNRVDNARINVLYNEGRITITNWGKYIKFDDVISCFSREYVSSNYDDDITSIKGGINGVGVKLTNVFSTEFNIESCSGEETYSVQFVNNMEKHSEPIIIRTKSIAYVKVSFIPDYDRLCAINKLTFSHNWFAANKITVENIVLRRIHEIATYTSSAAFMGRAVPVYYNGNIIVSTFERFLYRHKRASTDRLIIHVTSTRYPCMIGIIVHEPIQNKSNYASVGFRHVTMINSVMIEDLSDPVKEFIHKLETFVRNHREFEKYGGTKVENGKFPGRYVRNNITIITMMQYPTTSFTYKGQIKSGAEFDKTALADLKNNYTFPESFLEPFWSALRDVMIKFIKPRNKPTKKLKTKFYIPATCLISGNKQALALMLVEGNSAETLMSYIISTNKQLGIHQCGVTTTGGVPMNALKNSRKLPQGYQQNEHLLNNEGLQSLVKCLGLNPDISESRPCYNSIILCTDQDYDGVGKICSLIIIFFMLYFPHLVKAGFIKRYRTPIVRSKVGGKNYNFYSEQEFTEFKKLNPRAVGTYYKGLGVHDEQNRKIMARTFFNDLINVSYDEAGEVLMHVLYGEDTTLRKQKLLEFNPDFIRQYSNDLNITLSEHFNNESIPEQINNIERMTPHVYDGLVSVHRKILHIVRSSKKYNEKLTVSALGGTIKAKMNYNHGEAAIEGAIKYMAQTFIGSNWFPTLLPWSASNGSRKGGRTDTAQSRYTNIAANPFINYYYPLIDDNLLPYTEEEGKQYEPVYYISIVPRILLESTKSVATGWNSNLICREHTTVMQYVRTSIRTYPHIICTDMLGRINIIKDMKIIVYNNKEICIGKYELSKYTDDSDRKNIFESDMIIITQLPLGVWSRKYTERLLETRADVIKAIVDNTAIDIDIKIYLKPGILANIKNVCKKECLDPVVEYFQIYKIYNCNLNFFCEGKLVQYEGLHDIFKTWFEARRQLYIKRIEKQRVYCRLRVDMLENIYFFFANNCVKLIKKRPRKEQDYNLSTTSVKFTDGRQFPGFMQFHVESITMSIHGDAEVLETAVRTNASYNYLYKIPIGNVGSEAAERYHKRLITAHKEYNAILKETWENTWLRELDQLDKLYQFAVEKKWYWEDIMKYKLPEPEPELDDD